QHAQVGPDESIKLDVSIASELIRVEITDHGPGFEPPTDTGGAERERGWGLFFVSQLATRWGVEPGEPGYVWFEIDRTASGEEAAGQTAA
ncbi:MAG: serine/threonine-protein kinase RsbW, partial [Thermoleophilaceae bacterium]|nr:serine/threonine-protein kinase RsbW [Thermoleophilaceae bacterium]